MAYPQEVHILQAIQRLQVKIATLEQIAKLTDWKNIRLMFTAHFEHKEQFVIVDQYNFPYNLETELRTLLSDSIEQYYRDLETLNFQLKLTEDEKK